MPPMLQAWHPALRALLWGRHPRKEGSEACWSMFPDVASEHSRETSGSFEGFLLPLQEGEILATQEHNIIPFKGRI